MADVDHGRPKGPFRSYRTSPGIRSVRSRPISDGWRIRRTIGQIRSVRDALSVGGGKWPISVDGGTEPAWRGDGKELFYLAPDRYVMAVPIKVGSSLQPGTPQRLFEAPVSSNISSSYTRNQYVVTGDGQRFLSISRRKTLPFRHYRCCRLDRSAEKSVRFLT